MNDLIPPAFVRRAGRLAACAEVFGAHARVRYHGSGLIRHRAADRSVRCGLRTCRWRCRKTDKQCKNQPHNKNPTCSPLHERSLLNESECLQQGHQLTEVIAVTEGFLCSIERPSSSAQSRCQNYSTA